MVVANAHYCYRMSAMDCVSVYHTHTCSVCRLDCMYWYVHVATCVCMYVMYVYRYIQAVIDVYVVFFFVQKFVKMYL